MTDKAIPLHRIFGVAALITAVVTSCVGGTQARTSPQHEVGQHHFGDIRDSIDSDNPVSAEAIEYLAQYGITREMMENPETMTEQDVKMYELAVADALSQIDWEAVSAEMAKQEGLGSEEYYGEQDGVVFRGGTSVEFVWEEEGRREEPPSGSRPPQEQAE